MVKVVLSIGGNFTGTIQSDYTSLMPINNFKFTIFEMHYEGALNTFAHFVGLLENGIRDSVIDKTQKWYQEMLKRKDYEDGKTHEDLSVFEFLPKITE